MTHSSAGMWRLLGAWGVVQAVRWAWNTPVDEDRWLDRLILWCFLVGMATCAVGIKYFFKLS